MTERIIVYWFLFIFFTLGCKHINEKSSEVDIALISQKFITYPIPDESGSLKDFLVKIRLIEDKKWQNSYVCKSIS